ncbi:lecithin retinol acyltransferase family protein [Paraburkholderia sp.]|uniref:lecithin retinol acyltransferase family protein n=1 Tax=Paraburkholderia sp. TaxID=1926495 RepID=UPI0023A5DAD6|nr:lecithin retinol acyltransferase family protein [Paraburkholderia sp.]MDE1184286.1 lecithin retinol acyltransferase family protein [Paraburkholderia sp.]
MLSIGTADLLLDDAAADLQPGAHLVTQRSGYAHHGIYVGNGMVVHYAGFGGSAQRGPVEEVSLAQFAAGHAVAIRFAAAPKFDSDEAVRRARSRLGENRYRLLTNNCEHFCAWCLFGESRSEQVRTCLTHPRTGLHTLVGMCAAWMRNGKGAITREYVVARVA